MLRSPELFCDLLLSQLVDLLDELALAIAVAQLQGNVRFLAGAIVGIGKHGRVVLHRMDGPVDVLREFQLQRFEDPLEMLTLSEIHVLLAFFRQVRREGFVQQLQVTISAWRARDNLIPEINRAGKRISPGIADLSALTTSG